MDSYLKGRGFKDVESGDSNFEGFLEGINFIEGSNVKKGYVYLTRMNNE